MEYRENGSRYDNYCLWDDVKNSEYDYKRKGLVQYIMSSKIVNSENHILRTILSYFEQSIIFVLKYVDRLKHFKNYHWKNR